MFETVSEPKVGDDYVAMAVEKQILKLEVTVDNLLLVDIPDTRDKLAEELASVFLAKIPMRQDVVE
jgi:hypothetical protein